MRVKKARDNAALQDAERQLPRAGGGFLYHCMRWK